jgi:hypothetical protein
VLRLIPVLGENGDIEVLEDEDSKDLKKQYLHGAIIQKQEQH